MAGERWVEVSARFEDWWHEPAATEPPSHRGGLLALTVAGHVHARRDGTRVDATMTYDELEGLEYSFIETTKNRWLGTRRNGETIVRTQGWQPTYQETGVRLLLQPQPVLDDSLVLGEDKLPDGTRRVWLCEPRSAVITTRRGDTVDFGSPQGHWRHIADDIAVSGADRYLAVEHAASGVLLQWDALAGERVLRRLLLIDPTLS
jgi:hypothetical protein